MTHEEIENREIAESYVRGLLSEEACAAFEDHYFACDECFEHVEMLEKFVDGVRDAAETGGLPKPREVTPVSTVWRLRPAFFLAYAASLVLAVLAGWSLLIERPRLKAEAARERLEAEAGRKRLAELGKDLAEAKLAMARVPESQSNLPLVMLDASRAGGATTAVALPAGSSQLAVWVEPPPAAPGTLYRLEIFAKGGETVETIDGLARNAYGALAASVPAARLTPGSYRARLYSTKGAKRDLAGEYQFEVRR
jgi:hypothetical protein